MSRHALINGSCGRSMLGMLGAVLLLCVSHIAWAKGDGEGIIEKLKAQKAIIENPKLVAYVTAVGKRVAAHSDCPNNPFQFYVVDDASVNAFSTSDSYIVVHRGLLAFLKREDQLAAVLGHEIGHVCLQHVRQGKFESAVTNILATVGGFLTQTYDVLDTINAYGNERIASHGREFELQADHAGAIYMSRAGYDPNAILEMLTVLKDRETYGKKVTGEYEPYHGLFASHPQDDVRLQEVVGTAHSNAAVEEGEPVGDLLEEISGLTYGNSGSKGVVRGQRYYHGRLGFVLEFPEKWLVSESPSKILGYPPGGATAGYVAMQIDAVPDGMSPQQFLTKNAAGGKLSAGQKIQVKDGQNTHEGYIAHLENPPNTPGTTEIGVLFKDGRAHVFRAETRDPKTVDEIRKGFRYAIDHLQTISYADLKAANTEKIVLYEAKPGDSYEELAKATVLKENPVEELRLLNGDYPNGQPRAGDKIKLVR